jgi:hypothetical protein
MLQAPNSLHWAPSVRQALNKFFEMLVHQALDPYCVCTFGAPGIELVGVLCVFIFGASEIEFD